VIGGQTYTLGYDAENRMVSVTDASMTASFVYDGNGARVESTLNGVTTSFIGQHYEVTSGVATKHYFAGFYASIQDILKRRKCSKIKKAFSL
jgi:YD repeat-containing protein